MDALVPQFSSISIEQITEAFARQVVSTAKVNITAVIRENLPMWETKLFPFIAAYEISKYEVVADILIEAGCRSAAMSEAERAVFVRSVANAVRAVKVQQGELTATQKRAVQRSVQSSKAVPLPAVAITTPLDMSRPPVSVGSVAGVRGVTTPVVAPKPMAVAVAPVCGSAAVYDLDEFPFSEHTTRLKAEVNDFYAGKGMSWSESDDELLAVFSQISKTRFTPLEKLTQAFNPNESIKQGCYGAFKIKCKNMNVDLNPHGFQ